MKSLLFLPLAIAMVGCSAQNFSASSPASTNNAAGTTTPPPKSGTTTTTNTSLSECQAESVGNLTNSVIAQLSNNLSVSGLENAGSSASITVSTSVDCPGGGQVSANATTSLNYDFGYPNSSVSLTGSASVDFQSCAMQTCANQAAVVVTGTASLGSVQLNVNADEMTGAFSGSAGAQLSGTVQVVDDGSTISCTLALTNSESGSGTVNFDTFSASGTDSINTSGSVCGISITSDLQDDPFTLQ